MSVSPSLVVSPPLARNEPDMFVFPGAMSAPAPLTCLSERPETLSADTASCTSAEEPSHCHPVQAVSSHLYHYYAAYSAGS
jgi:hypothetical protein